MAALISKYIKRFFAETSCR